MNPLPPDPYLALGVSKTAQLSEIRSAHRKLVLKCHPDKVQDEALKAAKQDEFQKVQQAYEILSNEAQRAQYDAQVKLNALRKEMGRGGPVGAGPGAGANVYYAEPRSTASAAYRPKPATQTYSRYESADESRYSTPPRRSSSYETKSKSTSKDDERRARRKEEERAESRREAERQSRREKEAFYSERKKSRDKERRKQSEVKTKSYIEPSESDSDDFPRPRRPSTKPRMADIVVDVLSKSRRTTPEVVDTAREKTREKMDLAYRYMKAASRSKAAADAPRKPYVPDSPTVIDTIPEEDTARRSSGRTTRRPSIDTPSTSRRTQNSSRSREAPRLSSKDKKRSDPRIVEPERVKPSLYSQRSAPPEIPSTRGGPQRSNTMDSKHNSKGSSVAPGLPRASTFHAPEKSKSRSTGLKQRVAYESVSESSSSDSESDSPIYVKQPSPTRVERPSMSGKTSSYRIVKDLNGQRAAEKKERSLDDLYEGSRARSPSPRRSGVNYARTTSSRPSNTRAPQSQPIFVASQSIPVPRNLSPEPTVKTVRPGMHRETQSHGHYARQPVGYEEPKVTYAPSYSRSDVTYSPLEFPRRSSDQDSRFANYPAANQDYKREAPRKTAYT